MWPEKQFFSKPCHCIYMLCKTCPGSVNGDNDDSRPANIDGLDSIYRKNESKQVNSGVAKPETDMPGSSASLSRPLTYPPITNSPEEDYIIELMGQGSPGIIRESTERDDSLKNEGDFRAY